MRAEPERAEALARDALAAYEQHEEALFGLLDPTLTTTSSPTVHAQYGVRVALKAAELSLGPGVADRVRREVLGDDLERVCRGCGAEVHGDAVVSCRYCSATIRRQGEDSWALAVRDLWQSAQDDLAFRDELDGMRPASAAFGVVLSWGRRASPDVLAAVIVRCVAWLPLAPVPEAARILDVDKEHPGLSERLTVHHVHDPAARPKKPPLIPIDAEPWIENQSSTWNGRAPSPIEIISHCHTCVGLRADLAPATAAALFRRFHRALDDDAARYLDALADDDQRRPSRQAQFCRDLHATLLAGHLPR